LGAHPTVDKEIEVILTRQLASYLATPIFIVDPTGTLLYYNEPAELVLGRRFEETGEMPIEEWSTIFVPVDDDGAQHTDRAQQQCAVSAKQPPEHARAPHGGDETRKENLVYQQATSPVNLPSPREKLQAHA